MGLCFFGARSRIIETEVEQRGDSPVLVMHDGVTESNFAHLIPAKGVDSPSCEKSEDDYQRLGQVGTPQSGVWVRQWTGDVVRETSAEGDPLSKGTSDRANWRWSQLRVLRCQQTMIC